MGCKGARVQISELQPLKSVLVTRRHHPAVRVLTHIKKLHDCFAQFLVRVICDCGLSTAPNVCIRLATITEDATGVTSHLVPGWST